MPTIEEGLTAALEQFASLNCGCVCIEGVCPSCGGQGAIVDFPKLELHDVPLVAVMRVWVMSRAPIADHSERRILGRLNAELVASRELPSVECPSCEGSGKCPTCNGVGSLEPDPYSDACVAAIYGAAHGALGAAIDRGDLARAERIVAWVRSYTFAGFERAADAHGDEAPTSSALTPDELAALGLD